MTTALRLLGREVSTTLRRPSRMLFLVDVKRARGYWNKMRIERGIQDTESFLRADGEVIQRKYRSYEQYVSHQSAKIRCIGNWIDDYEDAYQRLLSERLGKSCGDLRGSSVLCLGARLGAEVKAFLSRGAFAVGIDLEPGSHSKYVLTGDFGHTVFPDNSVDCVFTNSLDHAYDLDMVLSEVARILKPAGRFIVEVALGLEEGPAAGDYEACFWKTREQVVKRVMQVRFEQLFAMDISVPYNGTHYVFRRLPEAHLVSDRLDAPPKSPNLLECLKGGTL